MSTSNFSTGQRVVVTADHNQFTASGETVYQIAKVDRISGNHMAILTHAGRIVGAIPESKIQAK